MVKKSFFLAVLIMFQGVQAVQEEVKPVYFKYHDPALHADRVACAATLRLLLFIFGMAGACALLRKFGYIE